MHPAIFLDRDGVLNVEKGYVHRIEDFEFLPGVLDALQTLQTAGFAIVVVTNQSSIGRGMYTEGDFRLLNDWMLASLSRAGIELAGVYYCPHAPEEQCPARKPGPGMLLEAARDLELDLANSWIVGDKETDVEAGIHAGLTGTVLVRSGHPINERETKALFVRDSLCDTVPIISQNGPPRKAAPSCGIRNSTLTAKPC